MLRIASLMTFLTVGVLAFGQTPNINTNGTVNSADYSRVFAPGGFISIFGSNLAARSEVTTSYPIPRTLGGASVELVSTGESIPMWYASPTQINAQLPYTVGASEGIRVRTSSGVSSPDTISVVARAPKIFTIDFSGQGGAVATTTDFKVLTAANPSTPSGTFVLWLNSAGPTNCSPTAGQPSPGLDPGSQPCILTDTVTANIGGISSRVTFAGLSPGSSGLYRVNIVAPFIVVSGVVPVQITVGNVTTQANVTVPYRQLGFYYSLLGGKSVTGQTLNGVSGGTSALAFRQSDQITWGTAGLNAWTNDTGLNSSFSVVSGLALTLFNGTTVVYDNNGIETNTAGNFYNNANGPSDTSKPGLTDMFSMSNYFPLVFAGYFRLAQSTTITKLTGYFDASGNITLPFDPANPYVKYRMNIWQNSPNPNLPGETGNFTGSVFASDNAPGTFSYSDTGLKLVSSVPNAFPKPIYRLTYTLASPLTLQAGEYWFGHDASVRAQAAASSTARSITVEELSEYIFSQDGPRKDPVRFSLFGQEMLMEDSYQLPEAVVVRPSSPITEQR